MKKVIELTKTFLKCSFSNISSNSEVTTYPKKKSSLILYFILILYLIGVMGFLSYNLLDGFIQIKQETVFIGMVLLFVIGFVIFQSIFSTINLFYFTKDSEYILPLPLKPYQIIFAKTNVLIFLEYIIEIFIGFVPLIIYGVKTGQSVVYYISMCISLLLIPILPVILVSIIIMIIMSFAKLTKNKNRFQLIATMLTLIIVIAISIAGSSVNGDITNEQMAQMIMQANGMLELIKGFFPTLNYLISALTTNEISIITLELVKTFVITAINFIIYLFIANKIYLKGLVGSLFSGSSKKIKTKIDEKKYQNTKLYKSYIGKEFKILIRNPIYLMQCIIPAILLPILIIGMMCLQINSVNDNELKVMTSKEMNLNMFIVACIILGIIQMFTMFIYISVTAISRDGKNAGFMKYIPVPLYKQYIYKIIPNIIMSLVSIIITLVIAEILMKLDIILLFLIFIVAVIMSVFQSILMIIIDLKRPKLEWDSEYAVVKQNLNLIFPVIFALINIGILVVAGIFLHNYKFYVGLGILCFIFGIATYCINRYLYKNQKELARKII